ncbi:MAG: histidine kinase, partial [Bacteroidia bacterium]
MPGYWTFFFIFLMTVLLSQLALMVGYGLITRKSHFLYYSLFLLSMALLHLARYRETVAASFSIGEWILYIKPFLAFLSCFLYFRFARIFLDLKHLNPKLNRLARRMELVALAYIPFTIFAAGHPLRTGAMLLCSLILTVGTILIQLGLLRYRGTIIRLVQLGSFVYFLVMFIGFLGNIGLPVSIVGKVDFGGIGSLVEVFFFSLALAFTLRAEEHEKNKARTDADVQRQEVESISTTLHEVRNRIARDMHDDVGSSLGTISLLSGMAGAQLEGHPAAPLVQRLGEYARETGASMNDAIWALNTRNDDGQALVKRMQDAAGLALSGAGIRYEFHVDNAWENHAFEMQTRKNLFLIFKEAMYNIVRHADASQVIIELSSGPHALLLTISDNGKGIPAELPQTGNGLR